MTGGQPMIQDALFGMPEQRIGFGTVLPLEFNIAADFIRRYHYLGRPGATSVAFGLWSDSRLIGACTYGTIISKNAGAICGDKWAGDVWELTRLVLEDDTPANSESYFIGQTFRLIEGPKVLLSYADTNAGHIGTIYQATNWLYTGYSTKGGYVTAEGELMHARSVSDSRKGINAASSGLSLRWRPSPPKHRYVNFVGDRRQKRQMRTALRWPVLPYPKRTSEQEGAA